MDVKVVARHYILFIIVLQHKYIFSSLTSPTRAATMDFPDPLSLSLTITILHRFRQVSKLYLVST